MTTNIKFTLLSTVSSFSEVYRFIEIDDIITVLVITVLFFFINLYATLHYDRNKVVHI
jgi:hypothetical protein